MKICPCLIAVVCLASPIGLLSQAPAATGVIAGRVVDGTTGQPIAGAAVRIGRAPAQPGQANPPTPLPPYGVQTNAEGQFVFPGLAAGAYTLTSQAAGYLTGQHGQMRI